MEHELCTSALCVFRDKGKHCYWCSRPWPCDDVIKNNPLRLQIELLNQRIRNLTRENEALRIAHRAEREGKVHGK